jgi:acid phosphatase type 7
MHIFYLLPLVFLSASSPPDQIRLSWSGIQGETTAVWVSYEQSNSSLSYRSLCNSSSPWLSVPVETKSYQVGTSPNRTEWIHSAVMTGLLPFCQYEYHVSNNDSQSFPMRFIGRTPESDNDGASTKLIVIADWGTGTRGSLVAKFMIKDIQENLYDGLVHVGDIAYNLKDLNGLNGDVFLNMVQPVASSMAYMVLPGNHEHHHNFSQYIHRFSMPRNNENQGTGLFYSFNLGPAHFVCINTDAYFYMNESSQSVQMNWLVDDLKTANQNREKQPWVIVMGHRPLYCASFTAHSTKNTTKACLSEAELLRSHFEEVFYLNGVDLYIQAHLHQYERMTPIYKNQTVRSEQDTGHMHVGAKAPVYITNGVGGSNEGMHHGQDAVDWLVYWNVALGYGRLNVANETHLLYEQVEIERGSIIDYLWIIKTQNRY